MTTSLKPLEPSWDQALNEPCPNCDRRKGDHTLDEYVECIRQRVDKLKHALQ